MSECKRVVFRPYVFLDVDDEGRVVDVDVDWEVSHLGEHAPGLADYDPTTPAAKTAANYLDRAVQRRVLRALLDPDAPTLPSDS